MQSSSHLTTILAAVFIGCQIGAVVLMFIVAGRLDEANLAQNLRLFHNSAIAVALVLFFASLYWLSNRLRRSEREIKQIRGETEEILSTVKDGLFLLSSDFRIGNQYSHALETVLNRKQLAGENFLELLKAIVPEKTVTVCEDYLTLLFGNRVNENLVTDLNPLSEVEVFFDDGDGQYVTKYLEFGFKRVLADGKVAHLLVQTNDITDQIQLGRELKEAQDKSKDQLDAMFKTLHVDPTAMTNFMDSTDKALRRINEVLKERPQSQADYADKLSRIEALIEPVQKQAAVLDLSNFEHKAKALGNNLTELSGRRQLDGKDFLPLTLKLDDFIGYIDMNRPLLNRMNKLRGELVTIAPASASPNNTQADRDWDALQEMIVELAEAKAKHVEISRHNTWTIPDAYQETVQEILQELGRNAVIHGIEAPAAREKADKPPLGKITVALSHTEGEGYELSVKDDGHGLSEPRLKQIAIDKGLVKAEEIATWDRKKIYALLFKPGFANTAENADTLVGMAKISALVREHQGKLWLSSNTGKSCEFRIWLPETEFNMTADLEIA